MNQREDVTLLQFHRVDGEVRQIHVGGDTSHARVMAVADQLAGMADIEYAVVRYLIAGMSILVHDTRGLSDQARHHSQVEIFRVGLEPKGSYTRHHRLGRALTVAAKLEEGHYVGHPEQEMIRRDAADTMEAFIPRADEATATAMAALAARLRG